MRKVIRVALFVLVLAFVAIQFFQPEKNKGEASGNNILALHSVPDSVASILKNSCFDCHTNSTNYHWYHNVAPASWFVANHIREGKKELNLSNWGEMDVFKKITTLEKICQESKHRSMPLKSYLIMHSNARLSDEEIAILCRWSEKFSEELLVQAAQE